MLHVEQEDLEDGEIDQTNKSDEVSVTGTVPVGVSSVMSLAIEKFWMNEDEASVDVNDYHNPNKAINKCVPLNLIQPS